MKKEKGKSNKIVYFLSVYVRVYVKPPHVE